MAADNKQIILSWDFQNYISQWADTWLLFQNWCHIYTKVPPSPHYRSATCLCCS